LTQPLTEMSTRNIY